MNKPFVFHALAEADTLRLGSALADVLPRGSIVGLAGTLGAGKTRLVQAVASASGIDVRTVVSPTYLILQEYQGKRTIFHFDLYRLRDEDEYLELGPEEYFERSDLTFLEWADRFEPFLPEDRLDISIVIVEKNKRDFQFTPHGEKYISAIDNLQTRLAS